MDKRFCMLLLVQLGILGLLSASSSTSDFSSIEADMFITESEDYVMILDAVKEHFDSPEINAVIERRKAEFESFLDQLNEAAIKNDMKSFSAIKVKMVQLTNDIRNELRPLVSNASSSPGSQSAIAAINELKSKLAQQRRNYMLNVAYNIYQDHITRLRMALFKIANIAQANNISDQEIISRITSINKKLDEYQDKLNSLGLFGSENASERQSVLNLFSDIKELHQQVVQLKEKVRVKALESVVKKRIVSVEAKALEMLEKERARSIQQFDEQNNVTVIIDLKINKLKSAIAVAEQNCINSLQSYSGNGTNFNFSFCAEELRQISEELKNSVKEIKRFQQQELLPNKENITPKAVKRIALPIVSNSSNGSSSYPENKSRNNTVVPPLPRNITKTPTAVLPQVTSARNTDWWNSTNNSGNGSIPFRNTSRNNTGSR